MKNLAQISFPSLRLLFSDSLLGAEVSERAGSRIAVFLFDEVQVYHRPHPSPSTDKGAVASVRRWLEENEVTP